MSTEKLTVVGIKTYDFEDEKTGKRVQGGKITYLVKNDDRQSQGYAAVTLSIPYDSIGIFSVFPGIYEIETSLVPQSGGRFYLRFQSAKFLAEAQIIPKQAAAAKAA